MRMNVALNGVGEPMRRAGESSKGAAGAADAGAKADDSSAAAADGQTSTAELQPETAATAPIAAGGVEEESTVNGELSWQEQMDRVGRREECTGYVKINEGDAWYVCTSSCHLSAHGHAAVCCLCRIPDVHKQETGGDTSACQQDVLLIAWTMRCSRHGEIADTLAH